MEKYFTKVKLSITGFFTALSAFLGWQGVMALVWVAAMAVDYLTGTAAAMKEGQWSSAVARQGLWHKGGMIAVVIVALMADYALGLLCKYLPLGIGWTSILLPLVLAWYIMTELGSVLENAVKMGAAVPNWLVKLLKTGIKAVDETGAQLDKEN